MVSNVLGVILAGGQARRLGGGDKALRELGAVIDCRRKIMYFTGPGGYKMSLSPGSSRHELEESQCGHLLLPCSRFDLVVPSKASYTFLSDGEGLAGGETGDRTPH